ncbi:tyrosine-protein phosphatase [Saccharopolyspora taberi]|uniref:Tyrosine-protein phosphatase n=1 Tax=Saccharopolyspora taberi TaxID=60895 RepID=A0ABN3V0R2_9PSEU
MSPFLELDGCFNFRDLGGHRAQDGSVVARGRLYRSDGLHRLTAAGRAAFDELGVVTVLDLRSKGEVEQKVWRPPPGWPGRWRHVPLREQTPDWSADDRAVLDQDGFAVTHYLDIVREGGGFLRTAVELLAEPGGLPAAFYCAAGKDRTGILSALVLRLVGVSAEAVVADYALSEVATARWAASVAAGGVDDTAAEWPYVPPSLLRADRSTMREFLRELDAEHGSVEGFAEHLGIGPDTISRLRSALLR